jgi:hypothetical protein
MDITPSALFVRVGTLLPMFLPLFTGNIRPPKYVTLLIYYCGVLGSLRQS